MTQSCQHLKNWPRDRISYLQGLKPRIYKEAFFLNNCFYSVYLPVQGGVEYYPLTVLEIKVLAFGTTIIQYYSKAALKDGFWVSVVVRVNMLKSQKVCNEFYIILGLSASQTWRRISSHVKACYTYQSSLASVGTLILLEFSNCI